MAKAEVTYKLTLSENALITTALDHYARHCKETAQSMPQSPDGKRYREWEAQTLDLMSKLRG